MTTGHIGRGGSFLGRRHRRWLGGFLPEHRGFDVAHLLAEMQRALRPVLRRTDEGAAFVFEERPLLRATPE